MSKRFYVPARYQMKLPGNTTGVDGGIIVPSGIAFHTLDRRRIETAHPHMTNRLLDPQIYLAGLNAVTSRKPCMNLASYGWFPLAQPIEQYDSGRQRQGEWAREVQSNIHNIWQPSLPVEPADVEQLARRCLQVQSDTGCEALILPSPLTVDQTTDYAAELAWLDIGMRLAQGVDSSLPCLASVAISDVCLRSLDPWDNGLIDMIIDQVSSREPDGVYIVLEQANESGYYCAHPRTVGALLRLVNGMKRGGVGRVVVGFAGMAGFLALLVGADAWSAGWYRGERRLKLADLDDSTGRAHPTYYSHAFAGEFHLDQDLDNICQQGLLPRITDETQASEPLLRALRGGRHVKDVAEWEYRPANVTTCREHFLMAAIRETNVISDMDADEQLAYAHAWLRQADELATQVSRLPELNERTQTSHQAAWQQAFRALIEHM